MSKLQWQKPTILDIVPVSKTEKGSAQCETLGEPSSGAGDEACS